MASWLVGCWEGYQKDVYWLEVILMGGLDGWLEDGG